MPENPYEPPKIIATGPVKPLVWKWWHIVAALVGFVVLFAAKGCWHFDSRSLP